MKKNQSGFTFKQFFVAHDKSPMKVTTDSVLLGAWTPLSGCERRILDIGTGCGVLALMLAQRTKGNVLIDAVDIDPRAVEQATDNKNHSPFHEAITVIPADICDFTATNPALYDVIVSNPPYFDVGVACRDEKRGQARYTSALSHDTLLDCMETLLAPDGKCCLVLPATVFPALWQQAKARGWHLGTQVNVNHIGGKPPTLVLFELSKLPSRQQLVELSIRNQHNSGYSAQFIALTEAFYVTL